MVNIMAPLASEAAELVAALRPSVVVVHGRHGQGAGVVWDKDGLVVTNHHVAPRERATVELEDGRVLAASVVAHDHGNDLALLRIAPAGRPQRPLKPAPFGDSAALRIGELVIAMGHPLGVRGTATVGIVSALGGATWMGRSRRDILQADVSLAPGNSGGPLVNMAGEVVGIASMILSPGIAIAVPSNLVHRFVAAQTGALRLAA